MYTIAGNGQRACTMVRFLVEHSIGMMKCRYKVCDKIKPHFADVFGLILRFIASLHAMFQIGLVNPSPLKHQQLILMNHFAQTFGTKHPIERTVFYEKLKQSKLKNSTWRLCTTKEQLTELLKENVSKWIFTKEELNLKTTKFYLQKAKRYLFAGKKTIQLWVNVENHQELIFKGIPKAMSSGNATSCYLVYNTNW